MWLGNFINKPRLASFCLIAAILLSGCGSIRAPVTYPSLPAYYKVNRGETLYSIAFRYGLDYRKVAALNHLRAPYSIQVGQRLRLNATTASTPRYQAKAIKPRLAVKKTAVTKSIAKPQSLKTSAKINWQWPTKGNLISAYSPSIVGNNGIDIAGQYGQAIYAAAPGYVVYCGKGLRGYGQLLIIKHSEELLSAYAHNSQLLVKEGMYVKVGQPIAKMGNSDSNRIKLHFEIRYAGKPVNPLIYLPKH